MNRTEVAITGLGLLCGAGADVESAFRSMLAGRSAVGPVRTLDTTEQPSRIGVEVPGFHPEEGDPTRGDPERPDRLESLLEAAVREAIREGAAGLAGHDPRRIGLTVGTSLGGWRRAERALAQRRGEHPVHPADLVGSTYSAPVTNLASRYGWGGPIWVLSNACAAGTLALVTGALMIRSGRADAVVAAGVDVLTAMTYSGFHAVRAASPEGIRPFDRDRQGLVLGEGAAALVLERGEIARTEGRPIRAHLSGCGLSADACGMVRPDPDGSGVARAIRTALDDAGMTPEQVDFVSAHGTGTAFNDPMETRAFRAVFGQRAGSIPMHSIKSMIGHSLGAAGAIEAAVCVRVLEEGIIPPTINLENPDPECDLDWVPNQARRYPVRTAVSTSSAFAGNNAALVLRREEP